MASPTIDDVCNNKKDVCNEDVLCFYARKSPDYLVYRNSMRVMVQFADDKTKAKGQRKSISCLNALRGQISGLIDGWHHGNEKLQARARRYDRRVADAIVTGLEGSTPDALALLAEIRDDIIAERKSIAQTDYLVVAALFGFLLLVAIGILQSQWSPMANQPAHSNLIWAGAAGGVLGAFFSIATGLRTRAILIDLQQWDNRRDALLRIAVGTIAGGILLSLFLTNMASIAQVSRATLTDNRTVEPLLLAMVLGFLGGFSERAVPGLLSRASLSIEEGADDVAVKQAKLVGAEAAHARQNGSGSSSPRESDGITIEVDKTEPGTITAASGGRGRLARVIKDTKAPVADQVLPRPDPPGNAPPQALQTAKGQSAGDATPVATEKGPTAPNP
jgi:hypothetical protein